MSEASYNHEECQKPSESLLIRRPVAEPVSQSYDLLLRAVLVMNRIRRTSEVNSIKPSDLSSKEVRKIMSNLRTSEAYVYHCIENYDLSLSHKIDRSRVSLRDICRGGRILESKEVKEKRLEAKRNGTYVLPKLGQNNIKNNMLRTQNLKRGRSFTPVWKAQIGFRLLQSHNFNESEPC